MSRILIVDDEFLIRYTLEEGLRDRGHETQSAENVEEGLLKARKFHPDVVLLDNLLEHSVGMDEIATFKAADPQIQVILMTAYGSVSQAVEAVKRGAYDYILKPFDIDDIEMAVKRSVEKTRNQESLEYLKGESQEFLGVSQAVQQIRRHIEILGENSSVNVLIRGETGTGKEVAARLIHDISGRPGLMVRINCGAIPENLLENELFGYERGAFAGAMRTKKGLIEMADGGTVFFDEVGEMPLAMQAKLLTFLDDRKIKRVGGLEDIEVDVRVVAATSRNLEQMVKDGLFRRDLYYRLNVFPVSMPPLRERQGDIPLLVENFLEKYGHKIGKRGLRVAPEAEALLLAHSWPGNIRELENVIERAVILTTDGLIRPDLLPPAMQAPCALCSLRGTLPDALEQLERQLITEALQEHRGNMGHAAQALGISERVMGLRMRKFGLGYKAFRRGTP